MLLRFLSGGFFKSFKGLIIVGEKIIKQVVYENDEKYVHSHFFNYLADVCEELDIPTPPIYLKQQGLQRINSMSVS